jgi:hypothetical protein
MKTLKNILESSMSLNNIKTSDNPKDCTSKVTFGVNDDGVPGLIIGPAFKYSENGSKEENDANQAIRFMKLKIGNDYFDWIDEYIEDSGDDSPYLCYFQDYVNGPSKEVNCYVYGNGGVYAVTEA